MIYPVDSAIQRLNNPGQLLSLEHCPKLPPPLLNCTVNFFQEIVVNILVQKNDVYATEPTSQLGSWRNNDGDVCVNVT